MNPGPFINVDESGEPIITNPTWSSPEHGGGITVIRPWRPPINEDVTPDVENRKQLPASTKDVNAKPVNNAPNDAASGSGFDMQTILIGGAVVLAAIILLTGRKS